MTPSLGISGRNISINLNTLQNWFIMSMTLYACKSFPNFVSLQLQHKKWLDFTHEEMTVMEALDYLNNLIDESDPDVSTLNVNWVNVSHFGKDWAFFSTISPLNVTFLFHFILLILFYYNDNNSNDDDDDDNHHYLSLLLLSSLLVVVVALNITVNHHYIYCYKFL